MRAVDPVVAIDLAHSIPPPSSLRIKKLLDFTA